MVFHLHSVLPHKCFSLKALFLCLIILPFISCRRSESVAAGKNHSNTLKYAEHLKMWKDENDTAFAEVYAENDTTKPLSLYIFPKGGKERYQRDYPSAVIITPETKNLLVYTSVFSSSLDEMGAFDKIGSVTDAGFFTDEKMKRAVASGKIADLGSSQQPSSEKLIALRPEIALVSVYDGMDVSILQKYEIPIVYMADNLERTPLGRAEWIKFLAYIAGKPEIGDSIFNSVESEYNRLQKIASESKKKPKVMVENMYQGVWYVPGGDSYAAKLLTDAGVNYPWSANKDNGSLSLSFEEVLDKAHDSDFWILKLFGENLTEKSLAAKDERNLLFRPVKTHNVWYSNTAESKLYDEFPYHPDLLLKDYILIFHPELIPDTSPRYFRRMTY